MLTKRPLIDKILDFVRRRSLLVIVITAIRALEQLPEIQPGIAPFNFLSFTKDDGRLTLEPLAPQGRAPRNREELERFLGRVFNRSIHLGGTPRLASPSRCCFSDLNPGPPWIRATAPTRRARFPS